MTHAARTLLATALLGGCGPGASSDAPAAAAAPSGGTREAVEVGEFGAVAGTRFLTAPLYTEVDGRSSYSSESSSGGAVVNHLFYGLDGRTSRWLFPDDGQRVLETRPLQQTVGAGAGDAGEPSVEAPGEGPVRAFLYRVVRADTNDDGRLDGEDAAALAVSGPGGDGYRVLVPSAGRLLGAFWVDGPRVLLVYEADGAVRGAELDVETREVVRRVVLPAAPGAPA